MRIPHPIECGPASLNQGRCQIRLHLTLAQFLFLQIWSKSGEVQQPSPPCSPLRGSGHKRHPTPWLPSFSVRSSATQASSPVPYLGPSSLLSTRRNLLGLVSQGMSASLLANHLPLKTERPSCSQEDTPDALKKSVSCPLPAPRHFSPNPGCERKQARPIRTKNLAKKLRPKLYLGLLPNTRHNELDLTLMNKGN